MKIHIDTSDIKSYQDFLTIKRLPRYAIKGHMALVPDEYASMLGKCDASKDKTARSYRPPPWMYDYQRDITAMAIRKRKFAVFADCGLGKTFIMLEYARHVQRAIGKGRRVLIVSPANVIRQTLQECVSRFGKSLPIERVAAADLQTWLNGEQIQHGEFGGLVGAVGITNYECIRDSLTPGALGAIILDESSMLKSHYGKWGTKLIELGKGLEWKLCLTGTPAPNDRIEYANHAVFMDAFPTTNSFLAKFFVNRGQTSERWEMKPHAIKPFYLALSDWCIFLSNPATYGWKDNATPLPPIHVHIHDVGMTVEQDEAVRRISGRLFADAAGGIASRTKLAQIAKGHFNGKSVDTLKPSFIRDLVDTWPDESTIIWCLYNHEQESIEKAFPEAASLSGDTPDSLREKMIDDFKVGRTRTLISKPKILGFGLNLQIATRQVFSGLQDSYEWYYQCIKRSNRTGSKHPLNVHIPVTDVEYPMIETVLRKASRVQADTEEQEKIFKENSYAFR
ncbi:MAG: hypothetical protein A4E20_08920 [Nitrospira sp. SG-bin2]|nr:MAG: hypothetical protein A4E20_08920 [Nitrospira sp. SG-bin2]